VRADFARLVTQTCDLCPFRDDCVPKPKLECKAWPKLRTLYTRIRDLLEEIDGTKELNKLMFDKQCVAQGLVRVKERDVKEAILTLGTLNYVFEFDKVPPPGDYEVDLILTPRERRVRRT